MSNPFLVQVPFAYQGNKNPIQLERQQSQDEEDATYKQGFPPVTMAKEELGGKPPKGLDFNGIFYELSSPIAHYCKGGRIYFDQEYANAIDGYPKGHIVASNDHSKDYISLVDNNTLNPNSNNITGYWSIYSGQGSIPTASSTISGTVKLINNLNSQAVDAALTAAQGRALLQMFANNLEENGYFELPNPKDILKPLLIQWGLVASPANYVANQVVKFNFKKAFPNSALIMVGSNYGVTYATPTESSILSRSQGQVFWGRSASGQQELSFSYIAIGY